LERADRASVVASFNADGAAGLTEVEQAAERDPQRASTSAVRRSMMESFLI
jgi:hypothetical protein